MQKSVFSTVSPDRRKKYYSSKVLSTVYLIIVAASFLISYRYLAWMQDRHLSALSNATLFYSPNDFESDNLADWIDKHTSVTAVDLHAPGAGSLVYAYTGSQTVTSPTLVLHRDYGSQVISGTAAVRDAFEPLTSADSPMHKGTLALIAMLIFIVAILFFREEVTLFASVFPVVGLVAVASLWSRCIHCYVGGTTISAFAPAAEVFYLLAGSALFTLKLIRKRIAYAAFMVISVLVPLTQSYLIAIEPKLCPACIAVTALSCGYFVASLRAVNTNTISGIAAPVWLRVLMIGGLVAMLVRHSLMLTGIVSDGLVQPVSIPTVVGSSINQYFKSSRPLTPGLLWVITIPGCHACESATADLSHLPVAWQSIQPCSYGNESGTCFDGKGTQFPTPMLIIANTNGEVVFQYEGWIGAGSGQEALISQITKTQRRVQATPINTHRR